MWVVRFALECMFTGVTVAAVFTYFFRENNIG